MVEIPTPKAMASALRVQLRQRWDVDATHSECLEVVARQYGVDNWNVLAAADLHGSPSSAAALPWGSAAATVPVLRVFDVDAALQFYVEFLGFTLDFGGPAGGEGTAYYGQVSRAQTTLHLTEVAYDPGPGATVFVWVAGLAAYRDHLNHRRETVRVWGPAVWAPELEDAPWGARVLTVVDPFGNHLRFNEPFDEADRRALADWSG